MGIKGMVVDEQDQPIFNATVKVYQVVNNHLQYIDHDVTSSKLQRGVLVDGRNERLLRLDIDGDYYRLLADGTYLIEVGKEGYESQRRRVNVNNEEHPREAKRLDFVLESPSAEDWSIRQMLRQYMDHVRSVSFG